MTSQLCYVQLSSLVAPSFWNKLSELKLDVFKLDASEKHIWGFFNIIPNMSKTIIEVDSTSFNSEVNDQNIFLFFHGKLINKNTVKEFKECDKMKLITEEGYQLYEKIKNGLALEDPSVLNSFLLLSFADLKKYHYYYWFAFPVVKDLYVENITSLPMTEEFTETKAELIFTEYRAMDYKNRCYFLIENESNSLKTYLLRDKLGEIDSENYQSMYFAFYNISYHQHLIGSQLRNYIILILNTCSFLQGKMVKFLSFSLTRDGGSITYKGSRVYSLKLPVLQSDFKPMWVGWEKNERDKMGPRLANMKHTLNPKVLAENAVDLNLKLMKWNLLPSINLEKIKETKFLLLGSGTLGCSVARALLGWGARNITFVDNSIVSFSNPVRQSLFTYTDSVKMKAKAFAAADNLQLIFPGVVSKGVQLTIPMPGHTVGESMLELVQTTVAQIEQLITDHDVVFLLTDSRESRWLPTLIGYTHNKIVINSALGFDSYLVMRHGLKTNNSQQPQPVEGFKAISGANLGCYFCNDVTAPGDSLTNRTLDQQCTVTRPGVSLIAGALAVELAVSVLQHDEGACAPAFYSTSGKHLSDSFEQSMLGVIPHSIRGFLHSYEQILPATEKYTNCIACSEMVVTQYEQGGIEFLLKVFNNSKHLEDVAQLTDMFNNINFDDVLELSDEDI